LRYCCGGGEPLVREAQRLGNGPVNGSESGGGTCVPAAACDVGGAIWLAGDLDRRHLGGRLHASYRRASYARVAGTDRPCALWRGHGGTPTSAAGQPGHRRHDGLVARRALDGFLAPHFELWDLRFSTNGLINTPDSLLRRSRHRRSHWRQRSCRTWCVQPYRFYSIGLVVRSVQPPCPAVLVLQPARSFVDSRAIQRV